MTEPGITLDPERGVNPHMTYCPRCHGESPELILLGANDYVWCCSCGQQMIGGPRSSKMDCPKCGCGPRFHKRERRLDEHEKLPATQPCEACQKEIDEHRAVVEAGGVYFRCKGCGREGIVKADVKLAADVRAKLECPAPAPCGVEFEKCPTCPGSATSSSFEPRPE